MPLGYVWVALTLGALPSRGAHESRWHREPSVLATRAQPADVEVVWLDARMQILDVSRPVPVADDPRIDVRVGAGVVRARGGFTRGAVESVESVVP